MMEFNDESFHLGIVGRGKTGKMATLNISGKNTVTEYNDPFLGAKDLPRAAVAFALLSTLMTFWSYKK